MALLNEVAKNQDNLQRIIDCLKAVDTNDFDIFVVDSCIYGHCKQLFTLENKGDYITANGAYWNAVVTPNFATYLGISNNLAAAIIANHSFNADGHCGFNQTIEDMFNAIYEYHKPEVNHIPLSRVISNLEALKGI